MSRRGVIRRALPSVLLITALASAGCSPEEYVAPPPARGSEVADASVAAQTVAALQDALSGADSASELAADAGAADLLGAVDDNVASLGLTDVTFRYVTETGRTAGDDAWDGLVAITWRIDGFDEVSSRTEVAVSFADGGRRIAAIGAEGDRLPLWLAGPLEVRRSAGALVLASAPSPEIDRRAQQARRAVTGVRDLLGGRGRLVVEIPSDARSLHRALGADTGQYDAIAAVTAPVDGSLATGSPVHVFLNPVVFDELDTTAAQVVMTHEATHALTGAAFARRAPLWLIEGFADHVALRDVDLPLSRTAGQVIRQVERDGAPKALPADTAFDPRATHLGAVYESSWQVTEALVAHGGEAALVALYRAVLGGADLAVALRDQFDWSVAELTAAWRSRLAGLAGVSE